MLPTELQCTDYTFGNKKLPSLNVSASKDKEGKIHITLCNLDPHNSAKLGCEIRGIKAKKVTGRILTASKINSHNTFEKPDVVKPETFKDVKLSDGKLTTTLPSKSVVVLEVE